MINSGQEEKEEHDYNCPLVLDNPGACVFIKDFIRRDNDIQIIKSNMREIKDAVVEGKTDREWLKKGYMVQTFFAGGMLISILTLILKQFGVI